MVPEQVMMENMGNEVERRENSGAERWQVREPNHLTLNFIDRETGSPKGDVT